MAEQHTAEPWVYQASTGMDGRIVTYLIGQADNIFRRVAATLRGVGEADARRIVACVNACSGIPTARLEQRGAGSVAELVRQRAALVEQLGLALADVDQHTIPNDMQCDWVRGARAAIAAAGGEA